jgi:hypothetical protein
VGGLRADLERTDLWLESVRAYNAQRQRQNRAEWYSYHADQIERHRRTLEDLIHYHEQKAQELMQLEVG